MARRIRGGRAARISGEMPWRTRLLPAVHLMRQAENSGNRNLSLKSVRYHRLNRAGASLTLEALIFSRRLRAFPLAIEKCRLLLGLDTSTYPQNRLAIRRGDTETLAISCRPTHQRFDKSNGMLCSRRNSRYFLRREARLSGRKRRRPLNNRVFAPAR